MGCFDSVTFDLHAIVLVLHTVFIVLITVVFIIVVFFIDNLKRLLPLHIRLRKSFTRLLLLRLIVILLLDLRLLSLRLWLRLQGFLRLRRLRVNGLTVNIVHDTSLFTLFQRWCLLLQWLLNRLLRDWLLHWLLSRLLLSRGSLLFPLGCKLRLCLRLRLGHYRLLLHGYLRLLQRLRLGHWRLSLSLIYGNWRLTLNLSNQFLILSLSLSLGLGYNRLLLALWLSPATLLLLEWLLNHRLLLCLCHLRLGLRFLSLQGLWLSLLTLHHRLLLSLGCL